MSNEYNNSNKFDYFTLIKAIIIGILSTGIMIFVFSLIMYFTESFYDYATVLATISVAFGSFVTAFYLGKKRKQKGILIGLIVGLIIFAIVTIGGFILDKGSVTINTLFHFIIIILSSMIGAVLGVNKKENKTFYVK